MAKSSILEQLKSVIGDMVDSNGNIRVMPVGSLAKLNLSANRLKLLSDIIQFLKTSDLINEETKIYIFNRYITLQGVNDLINDKLESKVGINTTMNKIMYSKRKLMRIFGERYLTDLLSGSGDIKYFEKIFLEVSTKYNDNSKFKSMLAINLRDDCINTQLTDEEFADFISIIIPYTIKHIRYIEENIDVRYCGYFNYLLSSNQLNEEDTQRFNKLKEILFD